MIRFISYTGEWPALCMGDLTLEIDGEIVTNISLISRGHCGFTNDYKEHYCYKDDWDVSIPDEEYKHLEKE